MTAMPPPPKRPWYKSPAMHRLDQAAWTAAQQAANTPPVQPHIWAAMTPVEQAQLMAQHYGRQAIVRAQGQSSRKIVTALVVIFVVIPVVILVLVAIWSAIRQ